MTGKLLESGAISAFCSSVATMLLPASRRTKPFTCLRRTASNPNSSAYATRSTPKSSKAPTSPTPWSYRRLPRLRNGNCARRRGIGPHRARAAQPRALLR